VATQRVQLTITDQRFFDDAQNKREAVRVWSLPWKLPYWIEKWDSQNEQAKVWVKVPKIPANGSVDLYIYYGSPTAESESNGEAVFEFFDDFEGDSLDTSKWDTTGGGTIQVQNGILSIYSGIQRGWEGIYSKQTFTEGTVLRLKSKMDNANPGVSGHGKNIGFSQRLFESDQDEATFDWNSATGKYMTTTTNDGVCNTKDSPLSFLNWFIGEIHYISQSLVRFYGDDTLLNEHTTEIPDEPMPVSISSAGSGYSYVDWIAVRKYAEQEPTVVVGDEEASDVSGWLYRRKITITNPNSTDLEHFQVAIDLDGSNFDFYKANDDGSDIRITYGGGRYALPYYIETWDTATPQAVIWVGIDSETKFYVELNPNNTTDESDPSVMDLPEATNYTLSKFEKYT